MIKLTHKTKPNQITKSKAFKPAPDELIYYNFKTPIGGYFAHLVKVSDYDGINVNFYALDLSNPDLTRGPMHTLKLWQIDQIWGGPPSTLNGWDRSSSNCAILFLSDNYVKPQAGPNKQELLDVRADPPNKWPRGAGDSKLLEQYDDLTERIRHFYESEALQRNPELLQEYFKLFAHVLT